MRISEALALDRGDVDLERGVLTIRWSKFGKSRLVPLHETTRRALASYAERRDVLAPEVTTEAFFVAENGRRLNDWSLQYCFARVCQLVGLRKLQANYHRSHGPRIHDLRHRFAATTLLDWYRTDVDVERELPKLSTYLGHGAPSDTYWYLEALPELLQLATKRLMRRRKEKV
jgi:integrase